MEPRLVELPGFAVVGLKYHGKNDNNEIPQLWTAFHPRIGETFRHAYETWMPAAGSRPTGGPEFELYREGFDAADPNSEFELYIPIM